MARSGCIRIESVNVGRARELAFGTQQVLSAIAKRPLPRGAAVAVRRLGLEGDEQADRVAHGGVDQAIYAYPSEHYAFWQTVRAQARAAAWGDLLMPGSLGENLTLAGVLEGQLWIGDRLRLPGCVLAVSAPRRPCFKLDAALGFAQASKMMLRSGWCGAYLAVIEPGELRAGDTAELLAGPREVNLSELFLARAPRGAAQRPC